MSASALVVVTIMINAAFVLLNIKVYREGWDHGYGAGYSDRDDETLHGEKPGTRRGRTSR